MRSDTALQALIRLATMSASAAKLEPASLQPEILARAYRHWAAEHALLTSGGSLRHNRLKAVMGSEFEHLSAAVGGISPTAYAPTLEALLGPLARQRTKPAHPLKHMVLIASMFADWESFLLNYKLNAEPPLLQFSNVGKAANAEPSWQDGHASAPTAEKQFLESVRSGMTVRQAAKNVGVTVTTGVRWAKRNGVPFTVRPKTLVPAILESIRRDLESGLDRAIVARMRNVSLVSIHRLLSSEPELHSKWSAARNEMARTINRSAFLALLKKYPSTPVSTLRKIPGNGWVWLSRHDNEWLASSLTTLWQERSES